MGCRASVRFTGGIFLLATVSNLALGSTQTPIRLILETPSKEIKRTGRETDSSQSSTVKVKNEWIHISTSTYVLTAWILISTVGNFAFCLYFYNLQMTGYHVHVWGSSASNVNYFISCCHAQIGSGTTRTPIQKG
jgi:hypothetical protein